MLLLCSSYITHAQIGPYVGATTVDASTLHTIPLGSYSGATVSSICTTTNPVTTAQWHFVSRQNETNSYDWIYSMVTNAKKETISCGFGRNTAGHTSGTVFKVDHNGNLAWSTATNTSLLTAKIYNFSGSKVSPTFSDDIFKNSDLWSIEKASDGYVAVGRSHTESSSGHLILILRLRDDGSIVGNPMEVVPPLTPDKSDVSGGLTLADIINVEGYSVAVDPNYNSIDHIVVGGRWAAI